METVQWKRKAIQKREWNLNLGCLGFSKLHKDPSKYSFKPKLGILKKKFRHTQVVINSETWLIQGQILVGNIYNY